MKNNMEQEILTFVVLTCNVGMIFGSISSKQICEKLMELGYNVDKKKIMIDNTLSSIGNFYVDVILYKKVVAKVKVELKSK